MSDLQSILDLAEARLRNGPLDPNVEHDLKEIVRLAKAEPPPMKRINWLPAPAFFNLNMACVAINNALGWGSCFLVGSATRKRDYRDVDVRCIIDDELFEKLFPQSHNHPHLNALWSVMCTAIAVWLRAQTGLPVDFQIQSRTIANNSFSQKEGHERQPLGVFLEPSPTSYSADAAQPARDS